MSCSYALRAGTGAKHDNRRKGRRGVCDGPVRQSSLCRTRTRGPITCGPGRATDSERLDTAEAWRAVRSAVLTRPTRARAFRVRRGRAAQPA
jgi:hypothetical protein